MENDIKDVWIGSYKLYIVLARFVDGETVQKKSEKTWRPVAEKNKEKVGNMDQVPTVASGKVGPYSSGSKSFKATLLGIDDDQEVLEIEVPSENMLHEDWNDVALVGRVLNFKTLANLRNWLSMAVNLKVNIKYLGGFHVALVFQSEGDMRWFLQNNGLWSSVFQFLHVWEGRILEFERIAWIKIYGIPTCLVVDKVITDIGSKFGAIIQSPKVTEADEDLSFVLVGLLSKSVNWLHHKLNLKWKDKVFPVLVDEDTGDWMPDCLLDIEEENAIEEEEHDVTVPVDDASPLDHAEVVSQSVLENAMNEEVSHQNLNNSVTDGASKSLGEEGEILENNQEYMAPQNLEGNYEVGPKNKNKSKSFRKKPRRNLSHSPVGQDRPKKRPRADEDLFDLDRFIFAVSKGPVTREEEMGQDVGAHSFQADVGCVNEGPLADVGLNEGDNVWLYVLI
ncbi:hypothetical protein HanLR1_Chr01g0010391 [Helianthus annuus]|nr:hypothetical protein HanLR1_Chr01g0010391 [Helianthus annuus]